MAQSLVVLTPIKQSADHNTVRIHREIHLDGDTLLHVAGGEHTGIVINRAGTYPDDGPSDVELPFSVWMKVGSDRKQETRTLGFRFNDGLDLNVGRAVVHNFFKDLMSNFPSDYVSFMKKVLKLMQLGYPELSRILLDYRILSEQEQVAIPDAAQYDSGTEAEEVTMAHIQEVLEHAYPNGLTLETITTALICSEEQALEFLLRLESLGIAKRVGDEWLRVDTHNIDAIARSSANYSSTGGASGPSGDHPTIAIISCLFVEKQAVDAIIEDSETIYKYKSGGDSNVYTIGRIGNHRVVATKLAVIGSNRVASTSAGSITTRLLGNFQHIEHVLIVGVGGSVPHYTDARLHARLGDVIVSAARPHSYVYAHDLLIDRKTECVTGFAVRKWNPSDPVIERIVEHGGKDFRDEWHQQTDETVAKLNQLHTDVDFSCPAPDTDVLAMPLSGGNVVVMPHPARSELRAEVHLGIIGALFKKDVEAEDDEQEENTRQLRERFAADEHVRALDAGFDSVVASIVGSRIDSWALVRGVADYQNGISRASRTWQAYAAVRAACLVRTIVERLPVS